MIKQHPRYGIPKHFDIWLIASFLAVTFWVEWIVNLTLRQMNLVANPIAEAFLDSLLVILISAPILLLFLLRPVRHGLRQYHQAREELVAGREQYRNLLEMLPDPVFLVDRQGRILDANGAAQALLSPDQPLLGQQLSTFVERKQRSRLTHTLQSWERDAASPSATETLDFLSKDQHRTALSLRLATAPFNEDGREQLLILGRQVRADQP